MNEDLDMEDLEARLYGEVYYPTENSQITSTSKENELNTNYNNNNNSNKEPNLPPAKTIHFKKINPLATKAKARYFKERNPNKGRNTSDIVLALEKLPNPLNKEVMTKAEQIKANRRSRSSRKRQRQKEKRRLEQLDREVAEFQSVIVKNISAITNQMESEVILLSDDEETPNVVPEQQKENLDDKKEDNSEKTDDTDKNVEEDEEVLFVEPPPIEVINVDAESEPEDQEMPQNKKQDSFIAEKTINQQENDRSTPDSSINDFLDPSVLNSSSNFNFSLHGKEFQDDFVKPTNPTNNEVYETESSCSTTDLPKDFSAKAVVFNECEFPQGDIFNEKNLESFGHYITPKRARLNEKLPDLSPVTTNEDLREKRDENNGKTRKKAKKSFGNDNVSLLNTENISAVTTREIIIETSSITDQNNEKETTSQNSVKSPVQDSFFHDIPNIEKLPDGLEVVDEVGGSTSDAETISDDLDADFRTRNDENDDDEIELVNCFSGPSKEKASDSAEGNLRRFDVDFIQKTMTDDPSMWEISLNDTIHCQYVQERGPRCRLCRQIGHIMDECPKRHNPIRCKLCGKRGHTSEKCPNDCCHHCGNKGTFTTLYCYKCVKWRNSVCGICRMKGHANRTCPDLWRRYCSTTTEGPINVLQEPQLKQHKDLWCSGCARNGHLEHNCNYSHRLNPPIDPKVHSFQEVYAIDKKKVTEMVEPSTSSSVPPILAGTSSSPKKQKNKINPFNLLAKKAESQPVMNPRTSPDCFVDFTVDCLPNDTNAWGNVGNLNFTPENRNSSNSNFNSNNPNISNSNNIPNLLNIPVWNTPINQFANNLSNIMMNQNFDPQQNNPNSMQQNSCIVSSTPNRSFNAIPPPANLINESNLGQLHSCFKQPAIEGTHITIGPSFHDITVVKCILFKPLVEVQMTLRQEMEELARVSRLDVQRMRERYRQSVHNLQNLKSVNVPKKHILYRCFRHLNIMIFGVHKMREGGRHLQTLEQVVEMFPHGELTKHRRNQIVMSYNYIFGARKIKTINYLYFLRIISEKLRKLHNNR